MNPAFPRPTFMEPTMTTYQPVRPPHGLSWFRILLAIMAVVAIVTVVAAIFYWRYQEGKRKA